MTLKRWKVTTRGNKGAYTARTFFRKSKAESFASDFKEQGLGHATVSRA